MKMRKLFPGIFPLLIIDFLLEHFHTKDITYSHKWTKEDVSMKKYFFFNFIESREAFKIPNLAVFYPITQLTYLS